MQGASPVLIDKLANTATISGLDSAHAYYFAITAYNTSGVESTYSNVVSVSELEPPSVFINSPASNASVSGTVPVTAYASDNAGVSKVEFYVNGVPQATVTSSPYLYSWNSAAVVSGTYSLSAKAYDAAGNIGQSSAVDVTVLNSTSSPGGTGTRYSLSDSLMALKISVGLEQPTSTLLSSYDVAPFVNGSSAPDGTIDIQDALIILQSVVGLIAL